MTQDNYKDTYVTFTANPESMVFDHKCVGITVGMVPLLIGSFEVAKADLLNKVREAGEDLK